MAAYTPIDSALNFLHSGYALSALVAALVLAGLLWSDQLKRRWYDRVEKKKWSHWNTPK